MNPTIEREPLRIKLAYRCEMLLFKLGELCCKLRKQHIFISSKDAPVNDLFCITCKKWKSEMHV